MPATFYVRYHGQITVAANNHEDAFERACDQLPDDVTIDQVEFDGDIENDLRIGEEL